ncbi:unnamed protein product [Ranitomeya imitator]|uniref:Uncharacterized protein n=1 Tax=Ranitomeya imitator TaxID=111125 RepID=A0ABN9LSR0_9NEOB|nr:unnamed protein product [Ranitomeya imitator]
MVKYYNPAMADAAISSAMAGNTNTPPHRQASDLFYQMILGDGGFGNPGEKGCFQDNLVKREVVEIVVFQVLAFQVYLVLGGFLVTQVYQDWMDNLDLLDLLIHMLMIEKCLTLPCIIAGDVGDPGIPGNPGLPGVKKDSQEFLGYVVLMGPKDSQVVQGLVDSQDLQDLPDLGGKTVLLVFLDWMALMDCQERQEFLVYLVLRERVVKFWVLNLVLLVSLEDLVS